MPRYIDADIAIEEIDKLQESLMSNNDTIWKKNKPIYKGLCNARGIINDTPTADVVPKSEYDKAILLLEEEIARLKNSILPSYYQACSEDEAIKIGIEYGKQEAKEEIDRLKKYNTDVAFKHYFDGRKDVASEIFAEIENNLSQITRQSSVTRMIAELKKKYTEGE